MAVAGRRSTYDQTPAHFYDMRCVGLDCMAQPRFDISRGVLVFNYSYYFLYVSAAATATAAAAAAVSYTHLTLPTIYSV